MQKQTSPETLEHSHTREAIRQRLTLDPQPSYVRDWVYGAIDGGVTTFAVVAGVVGANLSPGIALVLGFANLLADGFSMAASNYSGTKAEQDDYKRLHGIEDKHIDLAPDGEREEIRQIYAAKGFSGDDLERAVHVITNDRRRWIETMLVEEYGLPLATRSPIKAALSTFAAFCLCGLVPLLPFLFGVHANLSLSAAMTALVFFSIGSLKSRWSTQSWWRSGVETLAIGMAAASLAYVVGYALRSLA